jgi:O-antigen/teichoic acid export membrane protein
LRSGRGSLERADPDTGEVRGLARDSLLTAIGNGSTLIGLFAQIVLITHLLSLESYGEFALVVAVVSLCSRFFDLNAEFTVVAYGAPKVTRNPQALVGVLQFNGLIDVVTGFVGFVAVLIAAQAFGGDLIASDGPLLISVFGLTMLFSTLDGSCISVLQLLGQFRQIAGLQIFGEVTRIVFLMVGIWLNDTLTGVIVALVVQDALMLLVGVVLAVRTFHRVARTSLFRWRVPLVSGERRGMVSMLFHSNLVAYVRMIETQVPTLMVGAFHGATEAGLLKIGLAPSLALAKGTASFSSAGLPRIARLLADGSIRPLSELLRHATAMALGVLAAAGLALILLREPILTVLGGSAGQAAQGVLILGVLSQIVNGALFWNNGLLWAAKQPRAIAATYGAATALLLPLLGVFAYEWGAAGAAAALLLHTVLLNAGLTLASVRLMRRHAGTPVVLSADT